MCPETTATAPYSPRQRAVVNTTPEPTRQRRRREKDLDGVSLKKRAEPSCAPVQQEQHEADDDGRERERQVDDRVDDPGAREAPSHDRERADDAEHGVDRISD